MLPCIGESAILLLMAFRIQQMLHPEMSKEDQEQLRKSTREKLERTAREYAQMIVGSNQGKVKEGYELM